MSKIPKSSGSKRPYPRRASTFSGSSRDMSQVPKAARRAKKRANETVELLRTKGGSVGKLLHRLDGCTERTPCWSGACAVCGLAVREHLVAEHGRVLREERKKTAIAEITIEVPFGRVSIGDLNSFDTANFIRRMKKLLNKAHVHWLIGGLKVNLGGSKKKAWWFVRLHGFAATKDVGKLCRRVAAMMQKTGKTKSLVKVTEWDGTNKSIREALEVSYQGEITSDDPRTAKASVGGAQMGDRLMPSERVELTTYLDTVRPEGRLFLQRAQLRRSKIGPTLTLLKS